MRSSGSCFKDALAAARVEVPPEWEIPDWIPQEEIKLVCARLGLTYHGAGEAVVNPNQPLIVLFKTRENKGHAVYISDIGPLLECGLEIVGIIEL